MGVSRLIADYCHTVFQSEHFVEVLGAVLENCRGRMTQASPDQRTNQHLSEEHGHDIFSLALYGQVETGLHKILL